MLTDDRNRNDESQINNSIPEKFEKSKKNKPDGIEDRNTVSNNEE
jgi:hypothetical protein